MKALLVCAGFWLLVSLVFPLENILLPDMLRTLAAAWSLLLHGGLVHDLLVSLARTLAGVSCALIVGFSVGLGFGGRTGFSTYALPVLDFIRSIPIAMLFPLFIVITGIGELSRLLMVITLATPLLTIAIASGLRKDFLNRELNVWLALHRTQIPRWTRFLSLVWALLPSMLAGVKAAISLGLVMVIVSEMLFVANSGVGYQAYQAYNAFRVADMYAYVLVTGLVGFGLNALFDGLINATFFEARPRNPNKAAIMTGRLPRR